MAKAKATLKVKSRGALLKKYGTSGSAEEIVVAAEDMLWLPSRFLAMNNLTGGGIPYGKILELYGEESSGKSLLAFDFAYCCQALGGQVMWADSEFAFTRGWALENGLDLDKVELYPEKAIELISDWSLDMGMYYRSILTNNEPILLIVDSVAALDCEANVNSEQHNGKAEMGNRAKAMDRMLRTRNGAWEKLGITVIFINQVRANLKAGMFGDPETTPGGKALRFYASIRLGVYGGKQIKGKINGYEDRVGRHVSIRVKKNKVAPPKPTIKASEVYTNPAYEKHPIGFKKYFGFVDMLERSGAITRKKGASRYYMGEKMVANGEEALLKVIEKDDKLRKKLIRKSGVNTISKTARQITKISENLFKISSLTKKDLKGEE